MEDNKGLKAVLIAVLVLLFGVIVFLVVNILVRSTNNFSESGTDRIQAMYEDAINQINNGKLLIAIKSSSEMDARIVVEKIYDQPEFFWLDREYSISITGSKSYVQFNAYYDDYSQMLEEANAAAEDILSGAPDDATDYQMVKYVHDELCDRISYVNTGDESEHNIYGALVIGKCVCEGYAKAFMYVLNKAGIETKYFSGTSMKYGQPVPHAWNGLYLEDEFYYFDLTWDDIESEYVSYSEFALNSSDILRNHSFDEFHPMIESSATKYNYYVYNDYVLYNYSKENVADIVKRQDNVIDIKCSSVVVYNNLSLAFSNPYQLNEILTLAGSDSTGFTEYSYMFDESTYCVRLCLN